MGGGQAGKFPKTKEAHERANFSIMNHHFNSILRYRGRLAKPSCPVLLTALFVCNVEQPFEIRLCLISLKCEEFYCYDAVEMKLVNS